MIKKQCNQYFFSVEGETERWYFEHLQELINNDEKIPIKVKFNISINSSIISRTKSMTALYKKTSAFHVCDYESNDKVHVERFNKVLEELKSVNKINEKIDYKLGYSNFTFELWIILHKVPQNNSIANRIQYLKGINKAYNEKFQRIESYKNERNFKRILSKINLEDVINAIKNAEIIRENNKRNNKKNYKKYGKFEYYSENPDLTVHECVKQILKECKAIK